MHDRRAASAAPAGRGADHRVLRRVAAAGVVRGEWSGQTPGKRLFGLAVLNDDGTPVRWPGALTRNLLRAVDFLPFLYGVGLIAMLLNRDFKRLGDLAAGTVVVYQAEKVEADARDPAGAAACRRRCRSRLEEQRAVLELAERSATLHARALRGARRAARAAGRHAAAASARGRRACSASPTTSRAGNEAGAVRGGARRASGRRSRQFLDKPEQLRSTRRRCPRATAACASSLALAADRQYSPTWSTA